MSVKRVIPCLDVKDGRVVKGVEFVDLRDAGDPVEMAAVYDREGADEVVFLDIAATHEGRGTIVDLASRVAEKVRMPFTVGGGFRTVDDIRTMLAAGADRCSIGSAAIADPSLIDAAVTEFGPDAIVIALDARRVPGDRDRWNVMVRGGREDSGVDAVRWAEECARRGAGQILVTSMDRDGVQTGYDIPLTRAIARASGLPVTASGGAGALEHFAEAIMEGEADAVLAASVFHFGTFSIREVKEYLSAQGIAVDLGSQEADR